MADADSEARRPIVCDVGALPRADLRTIDALARLALEARRRGRELRIDGASEELRGLVALAGLAEVLPCLVTLRVEMVGQLEERKEAGGVEEERDSRDPPA